MSDQAKADSALSGCGDISPETPRADPAASKPKTRNTRETHALYTVSGTLKSADRGRKKLFDRRTIAGRYRAECYDRYIAQMGGPDKVTPQQERLAKIIVIEETVLDHLHDYLLDPRSAKLVNRRKRQLYPVVNQIQAIVDSLTRHLGMLGVTSELLPPTDDLEAHLAGKGSSQP